MREAEMLTVLLVLCGAVSVQATTFAPCTSATDNTDITTKCKCDTAGKVLQCSDLKSIPQPFDLPNGFSPIQLVITKSQLHDITKDQLANYRTLQLLQLVDCSVTSIDEGSFMSMGELYYLDLYDNQIKNITERTFTGLTQLTYLSLSTNQLEFLPPNLLKTMPNLKHLDLSGNHLTLHPDFFAESKVTNISLHATGLSSIPTKMLAKAKSLQNIMLDHNNISAIPAEAFAGLPDLEHINLDTNKITKIHNNAFKGLTKLRHLNLGNNLINELTATMMKPVSESLEEVYLEKNKLTTLATDVIRHDKIQQLRIGYNPWVCDCKIRWMKELDLQHKDKENVTCDRPEEYRGHSISNVTAEMLCSWCEGCGNSTVALAVGIPILIICVCLIVYYLYRIMQNRKQRAQIRKGYKYSNVYKDTVEPVHSKPPVAQIA